MLMNLPMRNAQNFMGTSGAPEWHPRLERRWWEGPNDPSVDEGPWRYERLLSIKTNIHKGKAMSYV